MADEITREAVTDNEHLNLVWIGFLISGAFATFFSLLGLLYMGIGIAMGIALSHLPASSAGAQPPPAFMAWIFGGMGLLFFLFAATMSGLRFWAARCVKRRKSRTFCIVVAAIECLEFPYGTAMGVLSIIVLGRESVRRQFEALSALGSR